NDWCGAAVRERRGARSREEPVRQLDVDGEARRLRADQVEVDVIVEALTGAGDVLQTLDVRLLPWVLGEDQDPLRDLVDRDRVMRRRQVIEQVGERHVRLDGACGRG